MKKVINFIIDVLLIALIFVLTDLFMIRVLHSESMFIELLIYMALYGVFFGAKWIVIKRISKK